MKKNSDTKLKKIPNIINSGIGKLISVYKNLSIRTKLVVVLNIVMLIPLVTISMVSLKNSEDVLKNKSSKYSQDILKIINLRVDDDLTVLKSESTDLLTDPSILEFVESDQSCQPISKYYSDLDTVQEKMKNKLRTKDEMQAIAIFDRNLSCFADKNNQAVSIKTLLSKGTKPYNEMMAMAEKNEGAPGFYLFSDTQKHNRIFYVRTILNRETYKNDGMLVILVDNDWFSSVFNGLVNNDMKKAAILSPENKTILSHNGGENYKLSDSIFSQMNGPSGLFVDNENKTLISYVKNKTTDWKIATFIPLSVLYSDVEYVKQQIIIALIFAIIFLLLISFYISYDFISSIQSLVVGMQKLQDGDDSVQVQLERKDELGFMGDTFNTMVKEITTLQKWVIREKLTSKDAQIRALQSQINPHFLFNTLETINWMAQLNNVPEISDTVTALASLMEGSIARDGKFITLGDEIHYIDNYIFILKKRFEDRLELVKNIDDSVLSTKVPRLLVQPLIENAANHGVANMRGKGIVTLTVAKNKEFIEITVEDNGVGIAEDELEILNERLSMNDEDYFNDEKNKRKSGIGIENVNRRIKLFYGEQFGLAITSKEGSFTKVKFSIPLESTERNLHEEKAILSSDEIG